MRADSIYGTDMPRRPIVILRMQGLLNTKQDVQKGRQRSSLCLSGWRESVGFGYCFHLREGVKKTQR